MAKKKKYLAKFIFETEKSRVTIKTNIASLKDGTLERFIKAIIKEYLIGNN